MSESGGGGGHRRGFISPRLQAHLDRPHEEDNHDGRIDENQHRRHVNACSSGEVLVPDVNTGSKRHP